MHYIISEVSGTMRNSMPDSQFWLKGLNSDIYHRFSSYLKIEARGIRASSAALKDSHSMLDNMAAKSASASRITRECS